MKGLTTGRIVHFVISTGEHRPAIVVDVVNKEEGIVHLHLFRLALDIEAERQLYTIYSQEPIIWTWHWIEPVE